MIVSDFKARKAPPPPPIPAASTLPNVVGLDYWEAAARMEARGIVANSYPVRSGGRRPSFVVSQSPPKGTSATRGAHVKLTVSIGRQARALGRRVTVPEVVGLSELDAHSACRDADLTCRTMPGSSQAGTVVRQYPQPGTEVPSLSQMKLFVGG